jgi:hypothetical protein
MGSKCRATQYHRPYEPDSIGHFLMGLHFGHLDRAADRQFLSLADKSGQYCSAMTSGLITALSIGDVT